jgi:hypothetical protein
VELEDLKYDIQGRTFTLAPTGSYAEFCRMEKNQYLLGIIQWIGMFWNSRLCV